MVEPKPYSVSQAALISQDRWAGVRKLMLGTSYDQFGTMPFPEAALVPGKDGRSCEGMLWAAFLLAPTSQSGEANEYFCEVLRQLPDLPLEHDFWISLTAFATICAPDAAVRFAEFLAGRRLLQVQTLTSLPLAARTNFLVYCVRHQRLAPALELVEQAAPNWCPKDHSVEAWAFRLAGLAVLNGARDYQRFSAFVTAYRELSAAAQIDRLARANIEVQLAVAMASSLRARGDEQAAIRHYRDAIALAEASLSPALNPGVLAGLWLTLARCHQAARQLPDAQQSYQRCIAVAGADNGANAYDLVAALAGLAGLVAQQGRHSQAADLYRQRLAVVEGDPNFSDPSRIVARNQLAAALVAGGEKAAGWQLFDQTLAAISRGQFANQSMLAVTLIARVDAGLAGLSEEALRWDVRAIGEDPVLSLGQCRILLGLAQRAADNGRSGLASDIVSAVADRSRQLADGDPAQVAALLRDLADGRIALLASHLGQAAEAELANEIDQIFSLGSRLFASNGVYLVKVAEQAFRANRTGLGTKIVLAVADRAADLAAAEPGEAPNLFMFLSQLMLTRVREPARAAILAQRGLDALDAIGNAAWNERLIAIRKALLLNVANM